MHLEKAIDAIYEAAIVPDMWEQVLDLISEAIGTKGGFIFTLSEERQSSVASAGVAEIWDRFARGNWPEINTRGIRAERLAHPGFITDLDVYTEQELQSEPIYQDFFYPNGLGWAVGSHIHVPNGDKVSVNFERGLAEGPIGRDVVDHLDLLRPHFARALSLTARLKTKLAVAMTDILGSFGLPACVINARGQARSANALMQTLIPSVLQDHRERIGLRHRPSDALLERAIRTGSASGEQGAVSSIPVPPTEESAGCVVHVLPIRGNGRDVISGGAFVLAVTQLADYSLPGPALLRGLFDLTPSEAKVARSIARGVQPRDISAELNISLNTVRAHLKAIFAKTGTTHQASLAHLLSGMRLAEGSN